MKLKYIFFALTFINAIALAQTETTTSPAQSRSGDLKGRKFISN
jgi:hypothetical protein